MHNVVSRLIPRAHPPPRTLTEKLFSHFTVVLQMKIKKRKSSASLPPPLYPARTSRRNPSAGINKIDLCVAHQLLAAGTDDGFLHLWDARQGQPGGGSGVAHLDLRDGVGAAAVSAADQTLEGFQVWPARFFVGWGGSGRGRHREAEGGGTVFAMCNGCKYRCCVCVCVCVCVCIY